MGLSRITSCAKCCYPPNPQIAHASSSALRLHLRVFRSTEGVHAFRAVLPESPGAGCERASKQLEVIDRTPCFSNGPIIDLLPGHLPHLQPINAVAYTCSLFKNPDGLRFTCFVYYLLGILLFVKCRFSRFDVSKNQPIGFSTFSRSITNNRFDNNRNKTKPQLGRFKVALRGSPSHPVLLMSPSISRTLPDFGW